MEQKLRDAANEIVLKARHIRRLEREIEALKDQLKENA
jgi:hypothetical protein